MPQKLKNNTIYITIAIFFSSLLLFLNPLAKTYPITAFNDRAIGNGTLNGVNISSRISSLYLLLFVIIPVVGIAIFLLLKKFVKEINENDKKILNTISIFGIINVIFLIYNQIVKTDYNQGTYMSLLILAGIDAILIIKNLIKKIEFKEIKWSLVAGIPLAFLGTFIIHKLNINKLIIWVIMYFISSTILCRNNEPKKYK